MGLRVATNVQSLAAQRHLGLNNMEQKRSLEKLSSGSRIVRAADDAAGLAISERMRAQIRSIRQNIRNANDGISLIQTAEGGMNEIGNILIRFRELSIQAASDTVGDTERQFIDKEIMQLREEVERISRTTEFNGKKLLIGEGDVLEFQIGTQNDPMNDRFNYDPAEATTTLASLGLESVSTESKAQAQDNLAAVDQAISNLSEARANMGAMQNRLQSAVNNMRIYDENLAAAKSRIRDVDMASETSQLVKQNILSQAGVSVLAQANQNNTLALQLL